MAIVILQEITRTGGTYAISIWRLNDNSAQVVVITQASYDAFVAGGAIGEPDGKPTPDAVFMMACGGKPQYNTPTGAPRIGDFYVADAGTRETWFFLSNEEDWGYGYAIADAPVAGQSRLQGREYKRAGGKFTTTLNNPQLNALRSGTFSFSNSKISIVNNVATVEDVILSNVAVDKQIPNHRSVSFDASSWATNGFATNITVAHTVGSNTDRYLVSDHGTRQGASSSATFAGNAMTTIVTDQNSDQHGRAYGYLNPASGANNFVGVAVFEPSNQVVSQSSFYGVDQASPYTSASANGSSTAPSVTISSAVNDMVYSAVNWVYDNGATNTPDATWTTDASPSAGDGSFNSSWGAYKTGAASLTRTDSLAISNSWVALAVSLKSAATTSFGRIMRPCLMG